MAYEFKLPELGEGIHSGMVVNLLIKPGDFLKVDDPLMEVESNKAVLVVPSPKAGKVLEIFAEKGKEIHVGQVVLTMETGASADGAASAEVPLKAPALPASPVEEKKEGATSLPPPPSTPSPAPVIPPAVVHPAPKAASVQYPVVRDEELAKIPAGPAARKLARELGVDLRQVKGSKRGGRIDVEDVKNYVKFVSQNVRKSTSAPGMQLPDFTKFGPTRREPLSFLRKIISERMSFSWSNIPHVHQFHEVNITDIVDFHQKYSEDFKKKGSTTSITPFIIKALAQCLVEFPNFNASLDEEKQELIYKEYYHVGVAVDTPAGLMVPVIQNVDQMTIFEIGKILRELAQKARERKVTPENLSGSCITISNLGGIGGSFFTPIINSPEVAILGVGKNVVRPVYEKGSWVPKTFAPLCLGYDHRVIDGADGARFMMKLSDILENFERFLLGG